MQAGSAKLYGDLLVLLGNSVMVAQMTLDHLVQVRILVPQFQIVIRE